MDRLGQAALHIGMPIVVGLVMGLNQVRIGAHLSMVNSVIFWSAATIGLWVIFEVIGRAVVLILRPWSPPLFVILLFTITVAGFPGRVYLYNLIEGFVPLIIDGTVPRQPLEFEPTQSYLSDFLQNWAGYFTFWLGLNMFLNRVIGVDRFGIPGTSLVSRQQTSKIPICPSVSARPHFLERVSIGLGENLFLLSAQDHYLEVKTSRGSELIHYALGDAIEQIEACRIDGMRIHRSHWVSRRAVHSLVKRGRRYFVILIDGTELPVGQTYIQLLQKSGFDQRPELGIVEAKAFS